MGWKLSVAAAGSSTCEFWRPGKPAGGFDGRVVSRYQIVFWRDIPVHIKVRSGGKRLSRPLSPRFQETVHRAAYRAKAISGFEYIREWRAAGWEEHELSGEGLLTAVAVRLEVAYSDERLAELAKNRGFEPGT